MHQSFILKEFLSQNGTNLSLEIFYDTCKTSNCVEKNEKNNAL